MKSILSFLVVCLLTAAAFGQPASISRNSNLRLGPSTSSKRIALLKAGTAVTIISRYPRLGYVRVQTAGNAQPAADVQTGWVWQKNVTAPQAPEGNASVSTVGPPPPVPGARAGDTAIYPIAQQTPGIADPTVTQDNLAKYICNKAWSTDSVRPSSSVTDKIKVATMKSYGFTDAPGHYELDHLISLQNGGCPDCVENLWPEAYGDPTHPMTQNQRAAWNKANPGSTAILAGSLEKDLVENHVHDEICFGIPNAKLSSMAKKYPVTVGVTLERGQEILATDWFACYQNIMDSNKPCQ